MTEGRKAEEIKEGEGKKGRKEGEGVGRKEIKM